LFHQKEDEHYINGGVMPPQETLTKFNWVDIVAVSLILITTYRGAKKGFIIEIFKLSGLVLSIYVSLHYFSDASDSLLEYFPAIGIVFSDSLCFIVLAVVSYVAVLALREVLRRFFKTEASSGLQRWGGLTLGFIRGILFSGMLLIGFYFLNAHYLKVSAEKSFLGSHFVNTNVKVYEGIFNTIVSKFSPGAKLNEHIYDVLEGQISSVH
jgi:membrane protein required for colicin V production